ncbi:MAG: amino acid adenylation domain-containing protein, partial [Bacteroidaceae bacterium]|nr:amino acid adenylation domain-containing protein [Bacteroidaceae bacterium]
MAPLSKTQYGIYAECVGHNGEICYNLPYLHTLDPTLDADRLCRAIETTVKAHPTLFTRITLNDEGEPMQTIADEAFSVAVEDIDDIEAVKPSLVKPFDIYADRLFRIRLLRDAHHLYLYTEYHHIIVDGTSTQLLLNDIEKAYKGLELEKEGMTQAEAAEAETVVRQTPAFDEAKAWFAQHFDCGDTYSPLMPDVDTGQTVTPQPDTEVHLLRALGTSMERIDAFCQENGIFKSTLFTSAFAFLLAKYNNEQESLFTNIYNGRQNKLLKHTVGMFVKTLPSYAKFTSDTSVLDFLKAGQEQMTGCRQHEAYAYSDLVNDLGLQSATAFAWHGEMFNNPTFDGKPMKTLLLVNNTRDVPIYIKTYVSNGQCCIEAEYNSLQYSEAFVGQLLESYEAVMEGFLAKEYLRDISIINAEQTKLLDSFNETDEPYDDSQTIVSLFRRQAQSVPDKIAVTFRENRYTYAEVDALSDRIAGYIANKGLGLEDVVAILIPRCEWMAIASLGVLKAGCAFQPLDPSYPKERLNFMVQDTNARLLIADEALLPIMDEYKGDVLLTKDLTSLVPSVALPTQQSEPKPSSLFTLIYTSGSTGVPKGGMSEHRNWVAFCHMHQLTHNINAQSRVAAYASFGFDASPMEIFSALTIGAELYIIPEEMRLDLIALSDYFEANGITHTFMTTQVAYQFATGIENHSLQVLMTGGEKLPSLVPPTTFSLTNGYGPSETICYVTNYWVKEQKKNIPIGKAVQNCKLYIVDKEGSRLPVGACGELWVAGPQVTRGYLNRPEKTAEVYVSNPFTDEPKYNRIYKTGDIVRYLPDGNIEFVGRRDGQVKIRGFRIELKEVESIIREFPGIKDATVQAFDMEGEGTGKFIAAYIVSDEKIDIEALNSFILEEKPPYMVPAVTMQIDAIPLNQNQKVNKRALPKPVPSVAMPSQQAEQAPLNVLEQELFDMIAGIVNNKEFGITTILGYAGLTSISAIRLAVLINKRYDVVLDAKSLVKTGTLQSIENEILKQFIVNGDKKAQPNNALSTMDYGLCTMDSELTKVPLSYAQTGVYVDCMKNPTSTIYNIPLKIAFPLTTDVQALATALRTFVKAHPELSIHFETENTEITQVQDLEQAIDIPLTEMSEKELSNYKLEFVRPFNLNKGPLYRLEIVKTTQKIYLLTDFHHLVFDGGSYDIFLHQLCDLMNGGELEPEDMSYAAFVVAEKEAEKGADYAAARDYFQSRLGAVEGPTEIPSDLTNPHDQGVIGVASSAIDMDAVSDFCRKHQVTPAHLTLAAVFYALSRFSNNERLCITTISGGRSNLSIQGTIGMFVNTLALSANIGSQSVMEFIRETSEDFDTTLTHENYPFAQIASDYDLTAEIMFAYQLGLFTDYKCQGTSLEMENLELNVPKFRIAFYIREFNGENCVYIEYDDGRYTQSLMQSLAEAVSLAVAAFMRQPDAPLLSVSLLSDEQEALLDSFNQTDVDYDASQTIVSLFAKQAKLVPDNIAVVYKDKHYTYKEVDEISDRIAAYVASKGLKAEDVVSVLIPRCEWMAIASLGILKAGCAYQPLDPSYPKERLNFMMQDAAAKLLIADEELRDIVDEYKGEVLLTKDIAALVPSVALPTQLPEPQPSSLFILLYTSGSTGVPKGCQLTHGNLVAFCHWYQRYYGLTPECHVAAYASYGFDACMMDMYPALTCGAAVYIIGEDIRLNLPDLNDYFNANNITHSFITTQVGYQFATNVDNHSLRHFSVGGEKLSALNPPKNYVMHNGYGPTECTIFTTTYPLKEYEADIPIGKPLDNMRLYIVDPQFHRLPLGAAGELWVSGPQVSRGYLNRPEKTAETYIENPFTTEEKYARVYRTGDIVRYLPDGNIQFVGRRDGQVKIRGFRIELKEVEAVIRQFPGIKDATVQAFDYENGGKYIAAYIVSDEQIDVKALNQFILSQKPPYMVPAATMQIDAIPLNQNQKVNRKALPAPVIQASDREYVEPSNEQERMFAKIFGDIL